MSFKGFFQRKSFCSMLVCFIVLGEIDVSRKRGGIKQMIALKKNIRKTTSHFPEIHGGIISRKI